MDIGNGEDDADVPAAAEPPDHIGILAAAQAAIDSLPPSERAAQPPRGSLPDTWREGEDTAPESRMLTRHDAGGSLTATEPLAAAIKRMLGRKPGEDQRLDSGDLAGLVRPHELAEAILQEWQPSPPENPIAKGIREIRHAIHDDSPRGVTPALDVLRRFVEETDCPNDPAKGCGLDSGPFCSQHNFPHPDTIELARSILQDSARLGSPEDSDAV